MIHKLALIQLGDVLVVSDDGKIARILGLGDDPWHLVATTSAELEIRIAQMNKLIDAAQRRVIVGFEIAVSLTAASPAGASGLTQTANGNGARMSFDQPSKGSVAASMAAQADIETLGLVYQQIWRLRKNDINTVGQLVGLSEEDLLGLPGIGKGLVAKVVAALAAKGYRLKEIVSAG